MTTIRHKETQIYIDCLQTNIHLCFFADKACKASGRLHRGVATQLRDESRMVVINLYTHIIYLD